MVLKRLGEDGHRRLRALVERFGPGNLAERLGLSVDGLESILSGYYEMSEEGVTNLGLPTNQCRHVAIGAPGGACVACSGASDIGTRSYPSCAARRLAARNARS